MRNFFLTCAFMCATMVYSDNYKILFMSHPNLVINGKQVKVGDEFNDDAAVEWGNDAQVVRIYNVSKNKQMVVSAKQVMSKTNTMKEILSENMHLSTRDITVDMKQGVIDRVKEYCRLMEEFSGDIEKIDNMETIYAMCENSNVSVFNDLIKNSKKDISDNSMPLQQYMMTLTDKFENSVKTSYSGYEYVKTVVQPSPLKEFDAASYAFVKVEKKVSAKGINATQHLNIIVNTATMKISSTISEDYEDPQSIYLDALELFNIGDYNGAIPLFEKVSGLSRFPGRYRANTMLGWIYAEQKDFQKSNDVLRRSCDNDPLGGVILASKILIRDDVPVNLINYVEGTTILTKLTGTEDKEIPTMNLIAESAFIDAFNDYNELSRGSKIEASDENYSDFAKDLITSPYTTDAFKLRGYYIKSVVQSKKKSTQKEALDNILMAEKLLPTAGFGKDDFEFWDLNISIQKRNCLYLMGDKEGGLQMFRDISDKPYAASWLARECMQLKNYKKALEYYRKAAELNNPFAAYIVSLSYLPLPPEGQRTHDHTNYIGEMRRLKIDVKGWDGFVLYLFNDKSLEKSDVEFRKWLTKAVELGNVNAMEDYAFFEASQFPALQVSNIPHALTMACNAACIGLRSNSWKLLYTHTYTNGREQDAKIPYEKSETYKTLKKLDAAGNGAASWLLYSDYLILKNDSVTAQEYLERSANANFYSAMRYKAIKMYFDAVNWDDPTGENNVDGDKLVAAYEYMGRLTYFPLCAVYGYMGDIQVGCGDYAAAIELYNEGIKERDFICYKGLANMYVQGLGVRRNLNRAKDLMKKSIAAYTLNYSVSQFSEEGDESDLTKLKEYASYIDGLIAEEGAAAPQTESAKLNEILDSALSADERIDLSQTLLSELFASPKAVVKTVGSNGTTVVSTETAEDFMLRLSTMKTDKRIVEVSSEKDKNNKYTSLSVSFK